MNTSKQINVMIVLLCVLLIGVGLYTIWDPSRAADATERTQEETAIRAGQTFANNCRQCHGNEGEGRIGPALNPQFRKAPLTNFTDPNLRSQMQQLVRNTISCGRIGTVMPPWLIDNGGALNEHQIDQLVTLITENPGNGIGWKTAAETSAQLNAIAPLPDVQDVLKSASITGQSTSVCGQKPLATPTAAGSATETATATPAGSPPAASTQITIDATDNKFDKSQLAIPAGQQVTLTFNNKGAAIHNWHLLNVKDSQGQEPQTKLLPGGQSETITFTITQPGTYQFHCDVHPTEMTGTLVVQ
jgi:plastocyanin/mono/diheme cytochrome c family protein